jgi:PilZ domain
LTGDAARSYNRDSTAMDVSERRRHSRINLDGSMVGRATVLADFRIVALSETGASLEMELPMAMGSLCDLSLSLPHGSVDLKGRVVHVGEPGEDETGRFVVGVDFESVPDFDQALLQSFLDRERRRAL